MPIGNLTSQLFANIYLGQWDFFVRQSLRPLAYVRYGDDFLLYCVDSAAAQAMQARGSERLLGQLSLTVNSRQNIIVPARRGLFVLGHRVYINHQVVVELATVRRALSASCSAATSCRSLKLTRKQRRMLQYMKL
ncbi:MAG: RNA-directed DNA polymerase [Candidatus Nomurabacteria bacterium]|jgi:hypothetical protein|nr:RNA-directed DNA polymerase [Candidatus Nomurabacteria bacterium]